MADNGKIWSLEDQEWWKKYSEMVRSGVESEVHSCPTAWIEKPVSAGSYSGSGGAFGYGLGLL